MLTIDTKSGEIKQVSQDELEKMLGDADTKGSTDPKQVQEFLANLDNGDLEVFGFQFFNASWTKLNHLRFNFLVSFFN